MNWPAIKHWFATHTRMLFWWLFILGWAAVINAALVLFG